MRKLWLLCFVAGLFCAGHALAQATSDTDIVCVSEDNGYKEYLYLQGPQLIFYYSSAKFLKKIQLRHGGKEELGVYWLQFPNDPELYWIKMETVGNSLRIICMNPNKTIQVFTEKD
jgi:hypothetical protein